MSREILFRGKRIVDGKWAESCCPLGEMHSGTVTYDFISGTVGQYTGLHDGTRWEELSEEEKEKFLSEWNYEKDRRNTKDDWNGRKIFEGDIVKAEFSFNDFARDRVVHEEYIYEISYHEKYCYFYLKRKNNNLLFDGNWSYALMKIEVIGNIFDNPELLNQ